MLAVVAVLAAGAFLASDQGAPLSDADAPYDSGNIHWNLTEGVLTLTLNGAGGTYMEDYGYGDAPWYDCRLYIAEVVVGRGITSIGDGAFYDCRALSSVVVPGSVASIGDGAFASCYNLSSVVISDGVRAIGDSAFFDCHALSSVVIPGSVTSIGDGAFVDCNALSSVVISDGVVSIGGSAFASCYNLSSVVIPGSVKTIGDCAFTSCYSLSSVVISKGVTSIGDGAFNYCETLRNILFEGSTPPKLGYGSFDLAGESGFATEAYVRSSIWTSQEVLETVFTREVIGDSVVKYGGGVGDPPNSPSGPAGADWKYEWSSGTLTFFGTTFPDRGEWASIRPCVRHVVIGEGIDSIGIAAFSGAAPSPP
jgi:hypothetical protein